MHMETNHRTGIEDYSVIKNNRRMRFGYTTGSCAAAAAQGAVRMLLSGQKTDSADLMTPGGILLHLTLLDIRMEDGTVSCAVQKDAGDDPDNTDGILVYVTARKTDRSGIAIHGGEGVGRATRPGLPVKPGEPAINPVPRAMILREAENCASEFSYEGGLSLTVSVPEGRKIAEKTFNPRLGIEGGISILGTTGIVEPMSERSLIASIELEMKQKLTSGKEYLLVVPGNYGEEFVRESLGLTEEKCLRCSNFVGETIDLAVNLGARGILFAAHIGKFVKVAAGIMNTHSHAADGRLEILASAALRAGADAECGRKILDCVTTDEAISVLDTYGIREPVMEILMEKIQFYLDHRSYERILLGAVVFSRVHGYLGKTKNADLLLKKMEEQKSMD